MSLKKINFGLIFIICFVLFAFYVLLRQEYLLSEGGRITICRFINYTISSEGSIDGEFEVYFNNKVEKINIIAKDNISLNKRFFIKVVPTNLMMKEVYWDIEVPDSLISIPANGWDAIPR